MITFGLIILYLVIGLITAFVMKDDDGGMIIIWPIVWAIVIIMGPFVVVPEGFKKLKKYNEKRKKAKLPPTATDVMNGIVATVVLEHFQRWDKENTFFHYKNIELQASGHRVLVGGEELDVNEELKKAISTSRALAKDWQANKLKYEKEQRMLNHLEEFMKIEA